MSSDVVAQCDRKGPGNESGEQCFCRYREKWEIRSVLWGWGLILRGTRDYHTIARV